MAEEESSKKTKNRRPWEKKTDGDAEEAETEAGETSETGTTKKVGKESVSAPTGKTSGKTGGSALAMAKAGKLYPVLDSFHKGKKRKKSCKKGRGKKDMISLNLDSKQTKCKHKEVHPGISHKEHMDKVKKESVKIESLNNIQQFISNVSQKNYANANKYLQAALENKFKQRIAGAQHKLGF